MPATRSCGNSHHTSIGTMALSRFDSTNAEIAMLSTLITWPIPIRCKGVRGRPISLCHVGNRKRSSRATEMDEDARTTTMMDAAGILTLEPRWRSIDRAWITDMLDWIAIGVVRNIPLDHIGKSLIRVLRSSTCCKVHSFHDLAIDPSKWRSPSVFNAARFKNLHQRRITSFFTLIWLWITRVDCRAHAVGLTTKSKYHASLSLQLKRSKVEIFILSRAVKISIIWSFKGIKENGYGKVCHPLMLHLKDGTKLLLVSYLYKESYFSLDFLILSN